MKLLVKVLICAAAATAVILGTVPAFGAELETASPDKKIVAVSLGGSHSGALTEDGSLYMWGDNRYGQLGDGTYENKNTAVKVMDDVIAFSLGGDHSAAITKDSSLYVWGDNSSGQLGLGNQQPIGDMAVPTKIMSGVEQVSLGGSHSAAIQYGHLYMWGSNSSGQLGMGEKGGYVSAPFPVLPQRVALSVSLGGAHSTAIFDWALGDDPSDGASLYTWGESWDGQLGDGHFGTLTVVPTRIPDDEGSISAGRAHTALLKENGTLWLCGSNAQGQLGNGSREKSPRFSQVMDDVSSFAIGGWRSAAVKSDGTLWMWGDGFNGILGNGTYGDSLVPVEITDQVSLVALGDAHTVVVKNDNTLWTWGENGQGQLGDATTTNRTRPRQIRLEGMSNPATSVQIFAISDFVEMGSTLQFSATIAPTDASDADTLSWSSSDENVAMVDASGKVTPIRPGKTTITATVGGVSDAWEISVVGHDVPAQLVSIDKFVPTMWVGGTQQLAATVEPSDSTDTVVWSSSDEGVLTVDQTGLVTAVGNGEAYIEVRAGTIASGLTGTIYVTTPVEDISLDATELEMYVGAKPSKLTATITPATASNKGVTWSSSDEEVATVDSEGNVTSVAAGAASITATTAENGYTATCAVTVKQHATGIALDKHELVLTGVQTTALKAAVEPDNATNKGVSWASSDEGVATVDAEGNVVAVGKGTATVTATSEDGAFSDACAVTVKNPATKITIDSATLSLLKGDTAKVDYALAGELAGEVDEAEAVTWSSSNESVATVASGMVLAKGSGAATIDVEVTTGGSKVAGTCTVTVTNPVQSISLSETSKTVVVGDGAFELVATVEPSDADAGGVTWVSSDPQVATVDERGGVTVHAAGSANITASTGGKSAACALIVGAREMAKTPGGAGFAVSVTATDSATVERLEQLGDEGGLNLVVQAIASLTAPAEGAIEKLTADGAVVAEQFDIHFAKDSGEEIVFSADEGGAIKLTVKVKLTDSMRALLGQGMSLQVHYVGEDGTIEDKQTWVESDFLCFTTEHFSDYVVTGVPPKDEGGQGTGGAGSGDGNQTSTTLPTGNGTSLAPTGDPLGAVALAVGALACLAAVVTVRLKHKMMD